MGLFGSKKNTIKKDLSLDLSISKASNDTMKILNASSKKSVEYMVSMINLRNYVGKNINKINTDQINAVDPNFIKLISKNFSPKSPKELNEILLDEIDKMIIIMSENKEIAEYIKKTNHSF
jgi:F420-dependent methylenetetrahydromethanopterin dehydrogenase